MDPTQAQHLGFGSGSSMVGQGGMVGQQMQNGAPALNQMGTNNPAFQQGQNVAPYPALPNHPQNPMNIMPPQPMQTPTATQAAKNPKTEAQILIEALVNRLEHHSDLEKRLHDHIFPEPQVNPNG